MADFNAPFHGWFIAPPDTFWNAMKVCLHSVDGKVKSELFADHGSVFMAPLCWSPDGNTLFHVHERLLSINVNDKSVAPVEGFPCGFRVNQRCFADNTGVLAILELSDEAPIPGGAVLDEEWEGWCAVSFGESRYVAIEASGEFPTYFSDFRAWRFSRDSERSITWRDLREDEQVIHIWVMNCIGNNRKEIATVQWKPSFDFVLSPNAESIVYAYESNNVYSGLIWRNLKSEEERLISAEGYGPAWSPAGRKVAYQEHSSLWVYDVKSDSRTKIVGIPKTFRSSHISFDEGEYVPKWSPNGRFVAFSLPYADYAKRVINFVFGIADMIESTVFVLDAGLWCKLAWRPPSPPIPYGGRN